MVGPPELGRRLLVSANGALAGGVVELVFVLAALWFETTGLITSGSVTVLLMEVHNGS